MSEPKNAVAYLRTSSSASVGTDKDSDVRQREAIHAYAKLANLNVTREFYDKAVSGTDSLHERKGFADMVNYCIDHETNIIIVETNIITYS